MIAPDGGFQRKTVLALLVLATALHLGLCALHTGGLGAAPSLHIPAEAAILAAAMLLSGFLTRPGDVACAAIITAYLVALRLVNPEADLIILRHLLLGFVFYRLGTQCDVGFVDRAARMILAGVLGVGVFELATPDLFSRFFNIWNYFSARGLIDPSAGEWADTSFFVSADRAGGRNMFGFLLGSHRVSSVFLEPVSSGNFAALCFAWFISFRSRNRWVWVGLSCVMVVLADSRFAAACCCVMAVAAMLPAALQRTAAVLAIPAVITILLVIGALRHEEGSIPVIVSDDFVGRISFAGEVLWSWGWQHWLALAPSPVTTIDAGHAYLANNLGAPIYLLIWLLVMLWHISGPRSAEHTSFVLMLSIYFALLLSVTGTAAFSMKTAALAWLLCGALGATRRGFGHDPGRERQAMA
ncbi:hypothetical protein CR165_22470 [Pseudoroseomonas aestuarii]|uniref:Polysaccharide polymerase n=2 Tax=Teichococcus aestuarii TaxID=568898 RepID=A0A2U1UY46_9PROT|nr:hypothetical protein CR165_22470 [Pseudoroseomonas aestuarii]